MEPVGGDLEGFKEYIKVLTELLDFKKLNTVLKQANRDVLRPAQSKMKNLPYNAKPKWATRAAAIEGQKHPNALMLGPLNDARTSRFRPPDAVLLKFFDKGTKERFTAKKARRGKIIGKHIVEPTLDAEARRIADNIPTVYGAALIKMVAKYTKKITK